MHVLIAVRRWDVFIDALCYGMLHGVYGIPLLGLGPQNNTRVGVMWMKSPLLARYVINV